MTRGIRIGSQGGYPYIKGSALTLSSLSVTPTSSFQTITAPNDRAYNTVNVSAVTSSVDANLIASNIKKDVTILGVTGTYTGEDEAYYITEANINGKLKTSPVLIKTDGIRRIDEYVLAYAYYNVYGIIKVSFPDLEVVNESGLREAFYGCFIKAAEFPKLTTIESGGLRGVFGLSRLKSISFPMLCDIKAAGLAEAFSWSYYIEDIYFGGLRADSTISSNAFENMLFQTGSETIHNIHFPSNLQSKISSLGGYPTFGGSSGGVNIVFDLPVNS